MTGKELYRIWAPVGKKWVDWVRPVPFVEIEECSKGFVFSNFAVPAIDYIDEIGKNAAIIVDLPGAESVEEGIALAKAGFRPIPIYNGTIEQQDARATVDNQTVGKALAWGAKKLGEMDLADDARPVFLLDRNRLNRFKMEISLFDNSWDVYHKDLPSAEYFFENGIREILVVADSVSEDVKKILYGFQKKQIRIFLKKGYLPPKKITLHKPLRREKD